MYYTIYMTTCLTSGWIYIGKHQTKDLQDGYMGSGKLLQEAINNYGYKNFSKEILHIFKTEEEMNAKEAELVTEDFCAQSNNFNLCPGGKGGWGYINESGKNMYGYNGKTSNVAKQLELGRKRIRSDSERKAQSELIKEKYAEGFNFFHGKSHSEEWKKAESERKKLQMKGSGNSQFGTMWITNGIENKKIKKTDSIPEGYRKGRKIILGP